MRTFVYLSIKTTRFHGEGDVVEICAWAPGRSDGRSDFYAWLIQAGEPIRPDVAALLSLPCAPVPAARLEDVLNGLVEWLPSGDVVWIGHHLLRSLRKLWACGMSRLTRTKVVASIDVHRLAHHLLAGEQLAFGTQPQVLARVLHVAPRKWGDASPFRAAAEVFFLRPVFSELQQIATRDRRYDLKALAELSGKLIPYTRLPGGGPTDWFAQCRGLPISVAPTPMLRVAMDDPNLDPDLRHAIEQVWRGRIEHIPQ